MKFLAAATALVLGMSASAQASTTFVFDFESGNPADQFSPFGPVDPTTGLSSEISDLASCGGGLGANGTVAAGNVLCVLGDEDSAFRQDFDLIDTDLNDALANAGAITFSVDIAGSGIGDVLEASGGSRDFVALDADGNQIFKLAGATDIPTDGLFRNFSFVFTDSQVQQAQNGLSLGVRLTGGNEFIAFDNVTIEVQAVPEPATWLMMLAGFAITGAALRRRGGVAAAA